MYHTISEEVAAFVEKANYNVFPKEVIEKSKQCILDVIGVTLYGSKFHASDIALSLTDIFPAHKEEATVLGKKQKTSTIFASIVNGISAHITDYDDYLKYFGHPSSVILSALLPVAESKKSNGRDFLTSFILGIEIGSKLGIAMSMNHYKVGFHTTSTVGVIAASIAISKLLELNISQIVNTIGIAASSAGGIRQNFGTMTKAWHVGHASSMAILSTLLSQKGFESSKESLEGSAGFINAFQGESKDYPLEELGNPYSILRIKFKKYPSCYMTHPGIVAALDLRKKIQNNFKSIKTIICEMTSVSKSVLIYSNPVNIQQTRFSIEYCVAIALLFGEVGPEQFTEEFIIRENNKLKEVMKKIIKKYNPDLDEITKKKRLCNPTKLTILLENGFEYKSFIENVEEDLLTWESIEEKFYSCCQGIISPKTSKEVAEKIKRIETIQNVNELTEKL